MSIFYKIAGRRIYYLLIDSTIIITSYLFSYIVRFYPDLDSHIFLLELKYFIIIQCLYISTYYLFQIYRIMWEYSNIKDVYRLFFSNLIAFLIYIFIIFFFDLNYSRLVLILSFLFIGGSTIFYRVILRDFFSRIKFQDEHSIYESDLKNSSDQVKRILVIGAGEAGRTILSEYIKRGLSKLIVGFIDDDTNKIGRIFNGKAITTNTKNVNVIIQRFTVNEIIIAIPSSSSEEINRIVSIIKKENPKIPIKTLPPIFEILDNKPLSTSLRDIGIVDLIGREEIKVNNEIIEKNIIEKTILVTGAGGSIGSEICKQLLRYKIKRIIAIGRGEFSIYNLIKLLNEYLEFLDYKPEIIYRIIDIKDYKLLNMVFKEFQPDIVFHAAAHKHVPLMEFNEIEALQNNVIGTKNVLDVSLKNCVSQFVLISSDKAVNPVNIMGATKRIAEMITSYYHTEKGLRTAVVRFGNVIGSRGSVIPLFREQIEKGGPVTVTHPEMTRYFMSIPEASFLVITAAALATGGELFILDMGKQYKILDIAKNLIKLYGHEPLKDIKIEFTGLRPGEKLFEELFYNKESLLKTENEKIYILTTDNCDYHKKKIEDLLNDKLMNIYDYNPDQLRGLIRDLVSRYNFNDYNKYKDLVSKLIN